MSESTGPPITSAAKLRAYVLLNESVSTGESKLFALVDGAACLIDNGGHVHSARLLVECVAPELASRLVRILTGEE